METLKTNGKYSPAKLIGAIAAALAVISGSALSWVKVFVGEPEAKEAKARINITWKKAMLETAELKRKHDKLHLRMVSLQSREEGFTAGVIQAKLDQVQAKYDALLTKTTKTKKPPVVNALQEELKEVRYLKTKLKKKLKATKPASIEQRPMPAPAPPPWGK